MNAGAPLADMSSHVNKFFLSEGKLSDIKMPWETPIMAAIFGSDDDFARLSQQLSPLPPVPIRPETVDASLSSVTQPQIASQSSCLIQHVRDFRIQDKRQELSMLAVKKLALIAARIGCLSDSASLEAAVGIKSPYTLLKRANALLEHVRWVDKNLPALERSAIFGEEAVWSRLQHLKANPGAPSKGSNLLSAVRFLHHVIGVRIEDTVSSRRIRGITQQLESGRRWVRQAEVLTVVQVKRLHSLLESLDGVFERAACAYLLIALYGRCRHSDLSCVHDVFKDFSGLKGFLQIRTGVHKTSTTSRKKGQLLYILVPAQGVIAEPWLDAACRACEGELDGPLFRPPSLHLCADGQCQAARSPRS